MPLSLSSIITRSTVLAACLSSTHACTAAEPESRHHVGEAPVPILAELYTSEGCSSCPPADRYLTELVREQPVDGAEIIAITQHVDYWDYLGWPDEYATAGHTERQQQYAQRRGDRRVYTPQLVVNGVPHAVGSQARAVRPLLKWAAKQPVVRLDIDATTGADSTVSVQVGWPSVLPESTGDTELRVVLVESGLSNAVERGENRGRTLRHAPTARSLVQRTLGAGEQLAGPLTLSIPADLVRANTRVVAVWQQPAGRVLAVGQQPLTSGG